MPIDTEQWRAQTGLYYAFRKPPPLPKYCIPEQMSTSVTMLSKIVFTVVLIVLKIGASYARQTMSSATSLLSSLLLFTIRSTKKLLERVGGVIGLLALSLVVVQMLLIMAGDVEQNPGPGTPPADQVGPPLATTLNVPVLSPSRVSFLNPSTMQATTMESQPLQQQPVVSQNAATGTTQSKIDGSGALQSLQNASNIQSNSVKTPAPHPGMKSQHRKPCGQCSPCQIKEDCGECKPCKNKKIFGGPGNWNKKCIKRKCKNMTLPRDSHSFRKHRRKGHDDSNKRTLFDCGFSKLRVNTESIPVPMEAQSSCPTADSGGQILDHDASELQLADLQRSDQQLKAMVNRAIKQGYIRTHITRSLVNGPPGVGKSHLLALLLGKPRPMVRNSTGVIEPPDEMYVEPRQVKTQMIYANEPSNWRQLTVEDKEQIITDWVFSHCYSEEINTDTDTESDTECIGLSITRKAVLEKLKKCVGEKEMPDVHLIHFMDTGGQPHFLEIQPAFVRNTSVNLVVFKMCEKLDERPRFEYVIDGNHPRGRREWLQITNLQMIKQTARTLLSCKYSSSMNTIGLDIHLPSEPKMMLVGTFKDKVEQCPETPETKEKILEDCLRPLIKDNILNETQDESFIFQIDGSEQGWDTNEGIINEIRQLIENTSNNLVADIPARWYFLQLDLMKAAKPSQWMILRLEDCYRIGKDLKIPKKEIEAALQYFNELTIFLYFKNVMKDAIFCDPHLLVKKISDLIAASFPGSKSYFPNVSKTDRENFRYCGLFTEDLLDNEYFQDGYEPNLFTLEDFINLLEYLHIIARTGKSKKRKAKAGEKASGEKIPVFFMPCALPPVRADDRERRSGWEPKSDRICPLMIHFPHGWSPRGLFCALIVSLASITANAPGWEVINDKKRPSPRRNLVEFRRPNKPGTVLMVDAMTRFEVHAPGTIPADCPEIRRTIHNIIDQVLPKFFYDKDKVQYQDGLFCDCGEELHVAVVEEREGGGLYYRCTKDDRHCKVWTEWVEKKEVWFTEDEQQGPSSPKRPKLATASQPRSWEYQTLLKNFPTIIRALAANSLANSLADELRSRNLIGDAVHAKATSYGPDITEEWRVKQLITAILSKIEHKSQRYHDFIEILQLDGIREDAEAALALLPTNSPQRQ